ncbi:MAG: hypothetical protein ACK5LS_08815 [Propioniciclava sp.]
MEKILATSGRQLDSPRLDGSRRHIGRIWNTVTAKRLIALLNEGIDGASSPHPGGAQGGSWPSATGWR